MRASGGVLNRRAWPEPGLAGGRQLLPAGTWLADEAPVAAVEVLARDGTGPKLHVSPYFLKYSNMSPSFTTFKSYSAFSLQHKRVSTLETRWA